MRTLLNVMASGALSAVLVVSSTLLASPAAGQADPRPGSSPTASREPGSTCRATSSRPTPRARAARRQARPELLQNHAEHRMRISLNPPSRRVQGEQEIVYTNHSPSPWTG